MVGNMLRGRSNDRNRKVTPPGPVYMSNDQFADYLKDLRTNRIIRPTGARPQPRGSSSDHTTGDSTTGANTVPEGGSSNTPILTGDHSHRRAQSALSTQSSVASRSGRQLVRPPALEGGSFKILRASDVVPTATYIERGQRWMEKEEAVSLRGAMEDLDLKRQEEAKLHAAAQNEASELIYQHQNPATSISPGAPLRYRSHLRKNSYQHARSASMGRYSGLEVASRMASDTSQRSVTGGSTSSDDQNSQRGRHTIASPNNTNPTRSHSTCSSIRNDFNGQQICVTSTRRKSPAEPLTAMMSHGPARRRSGIKRNISGELGISFTEDQIWEEPNQRGNQSYGHKDDPDVPAPLQIKPHSPLNRVQLAPKFGPRSNSTPVGFSQKIHDSEIHQHQPSQSRNPCYRANQSPLERRPPTSATDEGASVTVRNELEIRSAEIRQATSKRLSDRSHKLPTPTAVSRKADRPIVSFDRNFFQSKDIGLGQNLGEPLPEDSASRETEVQCALHLPDNNLSNAPVINIEEAPSKASQVTPLPVITFHHHSEAAPTVSLPEITCSLPLFNADKVQDHAKITYGMDNSPKRPLPVPKTQKVTQRRMPQPTSRGHWSPVGNRATATCHQCQLPIEGRVVKLHGAPENFHPTCFICFSCGTGLESLEIRPEPDTSRQERLHRIRLRSLGEQLADIDGKTEAEDGDERLRFFCHLDWHESFAPRCKHCKTPIMGEHMMALGEHWHYGHFFCAECGDPFEKGVSHVEKDGYAWCIACQTKRTERRAPKCKLCKQPVIGEYVQALGGEWHDSCFRCSSCQGAFIDGSFFPKVCGKETKVLCIKCIEKELKA